MTSGASVALQPVTVFGGVRGGTGRIMTRAVQQPWRQIQKVMFFNKLVEYVSGWHIHTSSQSLQTAPVQHTTAWPPMILS
jgi:hypothetical protein